MSLCIETRFVHKVLGLVHIAAYKVYLQYTGRDLPQFALLVSVVFRVR